VIAPTQTEPSQGVAMPDEQRLPNEPPAPASECGTDISVDRWDPNDWASNPPRDSIKTLFQNVEGSASKALAWYQAHKTQKGWWAARLRLVAIILFVATGIAPLVAGALQVAGSGASGWALTGGYVCAALGAGLLGVDRFYGESSGWQRYTTTYLAIRDALDEFRFDWAAKLKTIEGDPTAVQVGEFLQIAKSLQAKVNDLVKTETAAWIDEFKREGADLEARLTERQQQLQTQRDTERAAAQPGSINLTVTTATQGALKVLIDGVEVAQAPAEVMQRNFALTDIEPGQRKLSIRLAPAAGSQIVHDVIVVVQAGQTLAQSIAL
jgi:hypothetical protein